MGVTAIRAAYASGQLDKHAYIDAMYQMHTGLLEYAALVGATDIAQIEIADGRVIATWRSTGVRMLLVRDRRTPPLETLNFDWYERDAAAMVCRLVSPQATVFDIGANAGWYALTLAKLFPKAHIFAFEPIPETFAYLEQNIALNHAHSIVALNIGVSDRSGEATFYVQPDSLTAASSAPLSSSSLVEPVRCRMCSLDEISTDLRIAVDFIKCDVEGAELLVYRGGIETIRRCRPIIFSEMLRKWAARFSYHPNEIIALLRSFGYSCFTVQGMRLRPFSEMTDETTETNFFFLHTEHHAAQIAALAGRAV